MRALCSLTFFALLGCSPRQTNIGENVDAGPPSTATATGRVCTRAPDAAAFPVKVVFLVDQSGASCVTDPPGSQQSPGLCEQVPLPSGVTQPARVKALLRALNQFSTMPNVSMAVVPYETNVRGVWPPPLGGAKFGASDATLLTRINTLQSELGAYSDLQGALTYAHALIAADVAQLEQQDPAVLPRTSYRVVLLANGPAFPRCSSADNLTMYADDQRPTGIWADTDGDFCNLIDPLNPDGITGFVAGTDRNQNGQLLHLVSKLEELETLYHVGSVRLDARLLFDEATFTACGAACDRLFGFATRWPGPVPVADVGAFARTTARAVLQSLATRGGGTFAEATTRAQLDAFTLDSLDFGSLAAENVQKALVPQVLRGTASNGQWALDDDGDGLSNDAELTAGSSPTLSDTDGDGFDDQFEHTHASFDPVVRDLRGCDPASPTTPGCTARDSDGDGLSQFAEAFLQTNSTLADTDRDGLPDGLEVRWGLDPLTRLDPLADVDGDGVTDGDEVRRGSDPRVRDGAFPGVTVSVSERAPESDGRICYDFTVSQLPMLETPARTMAPVVPPGVNLFKLWFAESPRGLTEDVGTWSAACFFARRDLSQSPPILVPLNLSQSVPATSFVALTQSAPARTDSCAGTEALTP